MIESRTEREYEMENYSREKQSNKEGIMVTSKDESLVTLVKDEVVGLKGNGEILIAKTESKRENTYWENEVEDTESDKVVVHQTEKVRRLRPCSQIVTVYRQSTNASQIGQVNNPERHPSQ